MNGEVIIVGAGPAGLCGAFWRLHADPDCRVTVLEEAPRAGGWVRTDRVDGYACELGPQAIRPAGELDELCRALGAGDDLVPSSEAAKTRWIGRGGRLLRVPAGPGAFLRSPIVTLRGKLRLLREPFVRRGDPTGESVADFVRRRLGPETVPIVQAVVGGIYAGDAAELEVESAFPMLADAEREHGSLFFAMKAKLRAKRQARKAAAGSDGSAAAGAGQPKRAALYSFPGGMSGLVDRLCERLGDRVRVGHPVRSVERRGGRWVARVAPGGAGESYELEADELVLATPARITAGLVDGLDPELACELRAIPFASLASVYLGFDCAAAPAREELDGFGFLLEPGERTPVLGALYAGNLFDGHAPAGHSLLRVMIGGARHPEAAFLPEQELCDLAVDSVRRYTGLQGPFPFRRVAVVRDAIPQYEHGHAARLRRIEERLAERHPGLSLRGNSYRAVALGGQLGRDSGTDRAVPRPVRTMVSDPVARV